MYNNGIVSNSTTDSYTYGDSDWGDLLTAYNEEGITYDANGNPLSYYNGKRYTFSWQYGRRLASLGVDGKTYTYTYNADGLRVTKTVDGVVHSYFYDGTELLMEKWGNCYLRFTYDEQGRPFSVDYYNGTTLETYYYVLNLQGDVIEIRNSTNNVVCKYTYDAWGKMLSMKDGSGNAITSAGHIGNLNPLRYRGYYYDNETGLYYLRSRYYDPVICRFVNADGYISTGQGMLGYNMYAYCGNNPILRNDPNGKGWITIFAVIIVVAVVVDLAINKELDDWGLNDEEQALVKSDPLAAYYVNESKKETEEYLVKTYGENMDKDKTPANAYKHAMWNALMTDKIGVEKAKKFADAHEAVALSTHPAESAMDLHNNELGRQIAIKYAGQGYDVFSEKIQEAIANGEAVVIQWE